MKSSSLAVLLATLALAAVGAAPTSAAAQAGELGSPWGPDRPAASATPEASEEAAGAASPDEGIPEPPGSYEGPGAVHAPRIVQPSDTPRALALGVESPVAGELRLRSSVATRMRALSADLQVLSLRGDGSVVDGVLALVMGATTIGIGIAIDLSGSSPGPSLTPYLYVYGSAGILRGILDFAFMQSPSSAAVAFTHMPMADLADVRARLRFGEHALESLASNAELSRILDGSLSIATGLAVVPIYLGPTNFTFTSAFDYFVLIGAAVSVTTGTITLFSTNESERRWAAYRELRDRLLATEQGAADEAELEQAARALEAFRTSPAGSELRPILAAGPSGLFAGASGTF